MSNFILSSRSMEKLKGVHPDLIRVVKRALDISQLDFTVTCGLRTEKQQEQVMRDKASTTMNSRHLTGHAVDLAPLWNKEVVNGGIAANWHYFERVAKAMKLAGLECKIPVEWGGDWDSFKDGYHYQLTWKSYPLK